MGCSDYFRVYRKSFKHYLPICFCFGAISLALIATNIIQGIVSPEKKWNDKSERTGCTVIGYAFRNDTENYGMEYKGFVIVRYLNGLFKDLALCTAFSDLCSDVNLTKYQTTISKEVPLDTNLTCYYDKYNLGDVRLALKHVNYFGKYFIIGLFLAIPVVIGIMMLVGSFIHFVGCQDGSEYQRIPADEGARGYSSSSSIES